MKKVSCIVLILALGAYARFEDIAQLEETSFGKTILSTVAIQLSVSEGRVDEVIESLDTLKGKIQKDQDEHDKRHEKDQAEFQKKIDEYTQTIQTAQAEYDAAVAAIEEFTPKRDQAEKDLNAEKEKLKRLEKDLEDEKADRKRKYEEHLKRQVEFTKSIATAEKAIELISKLNPTFLQMPVLVEIVKDLPSFRNVSPSHAALLRVLVQLSTSKHASPELVKKALTLINKLKSSLEASKQKDLDDDKIAEEAHKALVASLETSISNSSKRVTQLDIDYEDYKKKVEDNITKKNTNGKIIKDTTPLKLDVEGQKKAEQEKYDADTARR